MRVRVRVRGRVGVRGRVWVWVWVRVWVWVWVWAWARVWGGEGGSGMVSAEGGGKVQEGVVALEKLVAPADERVVSKLDRLH